MRNKISKVPLSNLNKSLLNNKRRKTIVIINRDIILNEIFFLLSIENGLTNIQIPRTKPILAIFEPIILPTTIESFPLAKAIILTNNSGRLVPRAKAIIPTVILEILYLLAIDNELEIINSEL